MIANSLFSCVNILRKSLQLRPNTAHVRTDSNLDGVCSTLPSLANLELHGSICAMQVCVSTSMPPPVAYLASSKATQKPAYDLCTLLQKGTAVSSGLPMQRTRLFCSRCTI